LERVCKEHPLLERCQQRRVATREIGHAATRLCIMDTYTFDPKVKLNVYVHRRFHALIRSVFDLQTPPE